jgi:hypothetical protein
VCGEAGVEKSALIRVVPSVEMQRITPAAIAGAGEG